MKGLIGIGVVLGCLANSAQAAPEARIECTGEPRLEGAGDKGVEISTDVVGLVRVVGDLEAADGGEKGDEAENGDDVMSPEAFCDAHEGIDTFILPAPRVLEEPRSPDGEDELEIERPDRPDTDGDSDSDDGKTVDGADDSDQSAEGADDANHGQPKMGMGDLPDVAGAHKSLDPQLMNRGGCSQAVGHTDTGWWFALLPLLLLVRVRGEGDR